MNNLGNHAIDTKHTIMKKLDDIFDLFQSSNCEITQDDVDKTMILGITIITHELYTAYRDILEYHDLDKSLCNYLASIDKYNLIGNVVVDKLGKDIFFDK